MRNLIDVGVNALDADTRTAPRDERLQRIGHTAYLVSLKVRMLSARMKHPSFSDEEEWRLVAYLMSHNGQQVDQTGLRFRSSNDRLIPYEELSFSELGAGVVKEIVVGYSSPIAPDTVRVLARTKQLNLIVRRSDVPVR